MTAEVTMTVPVVVAEWQLLPGQLKIGLMSPLLTGARPYTYQLNGSTWAWVGGPQAAPLQSSDPMIPVIEAAIADAQLQPLIVFLNPSAPAGGE